MKQIMVALALLIFVSLAACTPPEQPAAVPVTEPTATAVSSAAEETEVRTLVASFGERLKLVSLLAPEAAKDLQKQYSEFVSAGLLETWMNDVANAPGRMVSSPWPDRIEITSLAKEGIDRYVIDGFIIEITSTEVGTDQAANKIPVRMVAERSNGVWLITEYAEQH
jgi:hypothetical protein